MNARTILAAALSTLGACSDDTGILVEVHGEQLQVAVARIDTMVIVDHGDGDPDDGDWGLAVRVAADVESVDLATAPYTVLFRPDAEQREKTVWIAALAYGEDDALIGWGELDGPVAFTPDLVKRVALHLNPAYSFGGDSACVVKAGEVVVRTSPDCDGDQSTFDVDCDDLDPLIIEDLDGDPAQCHDDCAPGDPDVYPGAKEECDGVDNDCDAASRPPPQLCIDVVREGDTILSCQVGQQICPDTANLPSYGPCTTSPIDATSNNELCSRWADCIELGGDGCFIDGQINCKLGVAVDAGGGACLPAATSLDGLLDGTDCTWRLIGNVQQGGWNVGLRASGSAGLSTVVAACDADFVVAAADAAPRVFLLEGSAGVESLLFAIVVAGHRDDCVPGEANDLECELQ